MRSRPIKRAAVRLRTIIGSAGRALKRGWGALEHWQRHWIYNILLGVLIELLLFAAHDSQIVIGARNWASDFSMRMVSTTMPARSSPVPPLALIDINEETWRNALWGGGEPYYAPRAQLSKLIDYAVEHNAKYVVLDVIVEGQATKDDDMLRDNIAALVPKLKPEQHILFVRTVRKSNDNIVSDEMRTSPLDALIARYPRQLHSAAPYFQMSRDGILRDWLLLREACRREVPQGAGHWAILPSVQMEIAALEAEPRTHVNYTRVLGANMPPCIVDPNSIGLPSLGRKDMTLDAPLWEWLRDKGQIPDWNGAGFAEEPELSNRIFFRFSDSPQGNQVSVIPAIKILDGDLHYKQADFRNGVVVIGQSFEFSGDEHPTPIGRMSGSLVILNSVDSLIARGPLHEPEGMFDVLLTISSIVLVGFIFARFDTVVGSLAIGVTFVPVLIALNFLMLRSGTWLDFSVPLIGLFIHRLIKGGEEYLEFLSIKHRADRGGHGGIT